MAAPPKNVPWAFDENETLLTRVREHIDSRGRPKWALVAQGLPGRTAQEARCRYRRISDAQARKSRGESFRNKCHKCGQKRRGHVCPGYRTPAALVEVARQPVEKVLDLPPLKPVEVPEEKVVEPTPAPVEEAKLEMCASSAPQQEKEESFPGLPNAICRAPSVLQFSADDGLNDLVAKLEATWNAPHMESQLKRLPSTSSMFDVDDFFNTAIDDGFDGFVGGLLPHNSDSMLGHRSIGVC